MYKTQISISPLKAKPSTKQSRAKGSRRRTSGAASAPTTPQPPQANICHGVQGPWPRKKFEASAAKAPTPKPARAPSAAPAATAITVTGCTPGTAANSTRPPAAAAPRVATSASVLRAPSPGSSQAAPATSRAAATSSSGSAACPGEVAAHAAAANATTPAAKATVLDMHELSFWRERDVAVGHRPREGAVMGDEQCCAGGVGLEQRCQLALALWVNPARRLVKHQQVGFGRQHRGKRQPFTLPAREVPRVPVLETGQANGGQGPARNPELARNADRDFLVRTLAQHVAAGILREVRR